MSLAKQEFTNAGRNMLGRAQASERLVISGMVAGDGAATQPSDLWPLTALISKKLDIPIASARNLGGGVMLVEGNFRSDAVSSSFMLREVGILAHIGTEADQLYSVANVFSDSPDTIDPATPTVQVFKIKLIIDRIPDDQITVTIGASEAVMGENVGSDTTGPGWYKETAGNVLRFKRAVQGFGVSLIEDTAKTTITVSAQQLTTGTNLGAGIGVYRDTAGGGLAVPTLRFKSIVQGDGVSVTQDAGQTQITVGLRQLTYNVDLYVPTTYPGAPAGAAFPTIQAAHDYLLQFRIPAQYTATIHVWNGTYQVSGNMLYAYHPDAKQIHVIGQPRIERTISSITYVNATQKRLAIADVSGLGIYMLGYVAVIVGYGTVLAAPYCGGCQLLAAPAPNNVLVSNLRRDSQGIYTTQDTQAGRKFCWYPCWVQTTGAAHVFNCPYGIGSIQNFVIICGTSGSAISLANPGGIIKNVMTWGGDGTVGVSGNDNVNFQGECVLTGHTYGVTASGTIRMTEQTYINGCNQGVVCGQPTLLGSITSNQPSSIAYLVHNNIGIIAGQNSSLQAGTLYPVYNDVFLEVRMGASAQVNVAYASFPAGNGTDLYAVDMGFIYYNRQGRPDPSCSPAPNAVGNQNSYIHLLG